METRSIGPDIGKSALIIVDMQNDFLHEQGKARREGSRDLGPMMEMVPRQARLIEAARAAGVPVIFVLQTTLPDQASSSDVWIEARSRARYSGQDMCMDGSWGQDVISELKPAPGDHFVKKYRYSGFLPGTSDLADRLRARGFDTVLITGTVTNVCCESSARDANMMNFRTIMVSDGNAALTQAEHEASLTAFYATFGDVMDTDMIIAALDRGAAVKAA